jgi:hypothetical protein
VQVRADVGKIVNPHVESPRHVPKSTAYGAGVFSKVPWSAGAPTAEDEVHGSSGADGPLEFASVTPNCAAVLGSSEFGPHVARKE